MEQASLTLPYGVTNLHPRLERNPEIAMLMTRDIADRRPAPGYRSIALVIVACALAGVPSGFVQADAPSSSALASAIGRGLADLVQVGVVSWYGAAFHDRKTASGEPFDSGALTMAHPSLPFGTRVKVTNLRNGRSVVVRVNDRGPFVGTRIADLSQAAATEIGMMRRGVARARIEVLQDLAVPETD